MKNSCTLCWRRREDGSEYCTYHLAAKRNLLEAFLDWQEALEIEWRDYLVAVTARKESGEWVRDIALHMLEKEGDEN